jgi:hypothetical protein
MFRMSWKFQPKRMVLSWGTRFSKNAHKSQNVTKLECLKNWVSQKMITHLGWNFENILRAIIPMFRQNFIMLFVSVVSKIYSRFIFRRTFAVVSNLKVEFKLKFSVSSFIWTLQFTLTLTLKIVYHEYLLRCLSCLCRYMGCESKPLSLYSGRQSVLFHNAKTCR